jgi:hypothetical protein
VESGFHSASGNEITDDIGQPAFVAVKAGDHRGQHFFWVRFFDFERVPDKVCQQSKEGELRSFISSRKA